MHQPVDDDPSEREYGDETYSLDGFGWVVRYRPVVGFPGYRVGTDGSVWSCWSRDGQMTTDWYRHKITEDKRGPGCRKGRYQCVRLRRFRDDDTYRPVHRLVLEAFVGPCPNGMETRHRDGDPTNNRLDNLQWGTKLENARDKIQHGTMCRGEEHGRAKLTECRVRQIREWRKEGITLKTIARRSGVCVATVKAILSGRTWRHVT